MSLWHRHLWRETSRRYNPSQSVVIRVDGPNGVQLAREMEFGITVVELACAGCGDVKAVRYVGDSGMTAERQALIEQRATERPG